MVQSFGSRHWGSKLDFETGSTSIDLNAHSLSNQGLVACQLAISPIVNSLLPQLKHVFSTLVGDPTNRLGIEFQPVSGQFVGCELKGGAHRRLSRYGTLDRRCHSFAKSKLN
jgi:hypothetical protein